LAQQLHASVAVCRR